MANIHFYVSSRIQELAKANEKQAQITVPHADVQRLLKRAGLDKDSVISRKRGLGLLVTVKSPKGASIPLTMADTHAIWFSHQSDDSAKTLLKYIVNKGGGTFEVLNVEAKKLAG